MLGFSYDWDKELATTGEPAQLSGDELRQCYTTTQYTIRMFLLHEVFHCYKYLRAQNEIDPFCVVEHHYESIIMYVFIYLFMYIVHEVTEFVFCVSVYVRVCLCA